MSITDLTSELNARGQGLVVQLLQSVHDYDVAHQEFTLDQKNHLAAQFKISATRGSDLPEEWLRGQLIKVYSAADAVVGNAQLFADIRGDNPVVDSIATRAVHSVKGYYGKFDSYDLARALRKTAAAHAAQGESFFTKPENAVTNEITGKDKLVLSPPDSMRGRVQYLAKVLLRCVRSYGHVWEKMEAVTPVVISELDFHLREIEEAASELNPYHDIYMRDRGRNEVVASVLAQAHRFARGEMDRIDLVDRLERAAEIHGSGEYGFFDEIENIAPVIPREKLIDYPCDFMRITDEERHAHAKNYAGSVLLTVEQYHTTFDEIVSKNRSLGDGFRNERIRYRDYDAEMIEQIFIYLEKIISLLKEVAPDYKTMDIGPVANSVVQYVLDAGNNGVDATVIAHRLKAAAIEHGKDKKAYFENPGNALNFNTVRSPAHELQNLDLV